MITFSTDQRNNYFLSNFYPYPLYQKNKKWNPLDIPFDGQLWPTSEHLYQALKFCNDTPAEKEWREIIRTAPTPYIAKYLGHQMTIVRYSWQQKYRDLVIRYKPFVRLAIDVNNLNDKYKIMLITVQTKFSLEKMRSLLKATEPCLLAEDSGDDWGIRGHNLLGKILMTVRGHL